MWFSRELDILCTKLLISKLGSACWFFHTSSLLTFRRRHWSSCVLEGIFDKYYFHIKNINSWKRNRKYSIKKPVLSQQVVDRCEGGGSTSLIRRFHVTTLQQNCRLFTDQHVHFFYARSHLRAPRKGHTISYFWMMIKIEQPITKFTLGIDYGDNFYSRSI